MLLGRVDVEIPKWGNVIIRDIPVFEKDGRRWCSPPSRPLLDRDGTAQRDENGKIRYARFLEFISRDDQNEWSASVVEAVKDYDNT
jgi:hypothetical protein